jgi:hypothetical protein
MRFLAEFGACLRVSTASNPSSTSCWRVRAMVEWLVSNAFAIWLSLHASPPSLASAFSFTTYLFTAISLAATNRLPLLRYGAIDSNILFNVNDGRH